MSGLVGKEGGECEPFYASKQGQIRSSARQATGRGGSLSVLPLMRD